MIFKKKFTHVLPDEPNKTSTKKNIQVECEYSGMQYLLIRVIESTGEVVYVERQSDNRQELETDNRKEDGFTFIILDADQHTWEAAYLTGNYTHGVVADYQETLPTGETYVFQWADGGGVIGQSHEINKLKYSAGTNNYIRPPYFVLPVTNQGFLDMVESHKADMLKAKEDPSRYTKEQMDTIDSYLGWLSTAADKYKGVDAWKIPTPTYPNLA
jgi:hypothetical protein